MLYDADGCDREVAPSADLVRALTDNQLLWVDVHGGVEGDEMAAACDTLGLPEGAKAMVADSQQARGLHKCDAFLHAGLSALRFRSADEWATVRVHVLWDRRVVLTAHSKEVDAFTEFRAQERGESRIGALTADVLVSALLDWHLGAFFRAAEQIEGAIDQFDERVLTHDPAQALLDELVRIRRRIARLRTVLASQREVVYGLTRPGIAQLIGESGAREFGALASRYDRVRGLLEHAAELVHGSFDLHASRVADSVNAFVKVLTFGTVLLGAMGVVAGILGMNFQARLFASGERGFWTVVAVEVVAATIALIFARRRRWI
jgi:magnesium transporter